VVAAEAAGHEIPLVFLEMIKDDFNKRYAGGKAATAAANSLSRDFGYPHNLTLLIERSQS
jgi:hypothetical protein